MFVTAVNGKGYTACIGIGQGKRARLTDEDHPRLHRLHNPPCGVRRVYNASSQVLPMLISNMSKFS